MLTMGQKKGKCGGHVNASLYTSSPPRQAQSIEAFLYSFHGTSLLSFSPLLIRKKYPDF
jgi:hypothetical protein